MKLAALVLTLLVCACNGSQAPHFYSFGEGFSNAEREVIRDAVAAWCEASGDCPRESMFSEDAHFILVDDLPEDERTERACPDGATCSTNANEGHGRIRIARNRAPGLDVLWRIAAHEWGHICIDGHPDGSVLMSAYQAPEGALEVDAGAVRLWHEGCH